MIGPLQHYISLERPVQTRNDSGGMTTEWTTVAHAFMGLRPLTSDEASRTGRLESRTTHLGQTWQPFVATAADRIQLGDRTFEILAVRKINEQRRWVELDLLEGASA